MKRLNVMLLLCTILGLLSFTACDNTSRTQEAQEQVRDEQADVQEAKEELSEQYQKEQVELQTEIREAQNRVDKRLAELRAEMNDAKAEAKVEINQRIVRLETKRDQLAQNLDRIDDNTNNEWEDFKLNVRKTLDDLDGDLD